MSIQLFIVVLYVAMLFAISFYVKRRAETSATEYQFAGQYARFPFLEAVNIRYSLYYDMRIVQYFIRKGLLLRRHLDIFEHGLWETEPHQVLRDLLDESVMNLVFSKDF